MALSVEELMKPRYRIIADWPGSNHVAGKIIVIQFDKTGFLFGAGNFGPVIMESKIKIYPHLFKLLEWWEERRLEDMPEYVKNKHGEVFKILKWEHHLGSYLFTATVYVLMINISSKWSQYTPATESEYNAYLKTIAP